MIVDQARIEANWKAIQIELDCPVPSRLERVLRRLGLDSGVVRIAAATPALRRAWFGALAIVVIVSLLAGDAARPRESIFAFLLLAPLVPVFGVTLSYGAASDPLHEIVVATPMRGVRLVVLRAAAVLGVSIPLLVFAALVAPAPAGLALGWLLPGLAGTGTAAALLTVTTPRRAGAITMGGWVTIVALVGATTGDRLAVFAAAGQIVAAVAAIVAAGVLIVRRNELDRIGIES